MIYPIPYLATDFSRAVDLSQPPHRRKSSRCTMLG